MSGLVPLAVVAKVLGLSRRYVRQVACDQGRPADERRYPRATHERFPIFIRDGNSRQYAVPTATWAAHLRRRGKEWTQQI